MKDGMSGMLQQVRLGQFRKARKSSIIQPPLLSMPIFQNSEKNRQIRGHPGGGRWWKTGLSGLFKQVSLGQVRKAKKSWKVKPWGPQSIRWPVLDKFLKERFLKERPTPIRNFKLDFWCNSFQMFSQECTPFLTLNNIFQNQQTWVISKDLLSFIM